MQFTYCLHFLEVAFCAGFSQRTVATLLLQHQQRELPCSCSALPVAHTGYNTGLIVNSLHTISSKVVHVPRKLEENELACRAVIFTILERSSSSYLYGALPGKQQPTDQRLLGITARPGPKTK